MTCRPLTNNKIMTIAIILAGGKGTRLKPMTDTTPKPLLRTPKRTILESQLQALYKHGVRTVYILIHQSQHKLYKECIDALDIRSCIRITLVVESEWLGTAGAVVNCLWAHPELSNLNQVIIMNGDIVCHYPFSEMVSIYKRSNCACLLTHFSTKDPSQYGLLKLTKVQKPLNSLSTEPSDKSSISLTSQNSDLIESLSIEDALLSSVSYSSSAESAGLLSEDFTDTSVENDSVTLNNSLVDAYQIMRIKDYDRIHRSGTSIARVSAPHLPGSPAGLRVNKYKDGRCNIYTNARSEGRTKARGGIQTVSLDPMQLDSSYGHVSLSDYSSRCLHSLSKQITSRAAKRSLSKNSTIRLGKVLEFIEKPRCIAYNRQNGGRSMEAEEVSHANAGIYIINPSLLLSFPVPCSMENTVFPALVARKMTLLSLYVGEEKTWSDMGTVAGFIKGCQLLNNIPAADTGSSNSFGQTDGQPSRHKPKGTCLGSVIDDTARISTKANVVNSVIYENVIIPPGVYLDGCIVCSAEKLSPGKHYYNTIIC